MATKGAFMGGAIPAVSNTPQSVVQALLAVKQNIEADPNFPRAYPYVAPSTQKSQLGAALRSVVKTLPF